MYQYLESEVYFPPPKKKGDGHCEVSPPGKLKGEMGFFLVTVNAIAVAAILLVAYEGWVDVSRGCFSVNSANYCSAIT